MAQPGNNGEFHRADPAYRRQMQVWLGITVVLGALLLVGLQWWLRRISVNADTGDLYSYQTWLHRLLAGLCLVLAVSAAVFAAWLHRTARATAQERRWPPTAMRTSADVRVRYLTSADALVAQLRGASIALALVAAFLAAWAIYLFRTT